MTIDWNVDTPIPRRPAPPARTRARMPRPKRRVPRGFGAILGIALVLALMLASCGLLGDLDAGGEAATRHAVRPVTPHPTVHPLRIRWGVDRLADPTALLVDGADAFAVEPYAVSSIAVPTGTTTWRVDVKDAEPFVAARANTVLVGAVDGFEALHRDTGASRWRVTIDDPYDRGRTVGLVDTAAGPVAVLTTMRGGVVGVDAATGVTRWSATVDGSPHGQLVTDDRTGLVALSMDHGDRVELHVIDGASGTERWSASFGIMTGLPLFDGPRLVLDTGGIDTPGTVIAFDAAAGTRVWTARVAGPSESGEGGTVDGDRIVLVDGLGTVTALDRTTGRRIWAIDLPMPVFHGRPIATGDVLVLRDISGVIQILDRRSGQHRGSFRTTGIGVGFGGGPAGLVLARRDVVHHQVIGLPPAMLTMRTPNRTPPVPVAAVPTVRRTAPVG
jgi:outer membrane protein assembly factor BamB